MKWKGYESIEDQTLEPEENLYAFIACLFSVAFLTNWAFFREDAQEAVNEYYERIGGKPQKRSKKRKSQPRDSTSTPQLSSKKSKKPTRPSTNGTTGEIDRSAPSSWVSDSDNWENEINVIDTIVKEHEDGKEPKLYVYLQWQNNTYSKVSIQQCYEKCPKRVGILFFLDQSKERS